MPSEMAVAKTAGTESSEEMQSEEKPVPATAEGVRAAGRVVWKLALLFPLKVFCCLHLRLFLTPIFPPRAAGNLSSPYFYLIVAFSHFEMGSFAVFMLF
jgi:hypothetical protein